MFGNFFNGVKTMEFMEMLEEWLALRDAGKVGIDSRLYPQQYIDTFRKLELEQELNKRMRGEL